MAILTQGEELILRGLHLLIRASFSPTGNSPEAERRAMEHFGALRADIGPWLTDYAKAMSDNLDEIKANLRDGAS